MNDLLNAQEIAEILKITRNTVYELIKRGELPAVKVGKQVRVSRATVESYLAGGQRPAAHQPLAQEAPQTARLTPALVENPPRTNEFIICGQDVSLDILANLLETRSGALQVHRSYKSSYNGIYSLYQRQVDLATAHLWDGDTGAYNASYVKKMMPGIPALLMRIAKRNIGLIVKKGNPDGITGFADFKRSGIRIVNREAGSGCRVFLDENLRLMGLSGERIDGYFNTVKSGFAVCGAVIGGEADVGIGSSSSALNVSEVDFIPLREECFDLIIRRSDAEKPQFQAVLEVVASESFKSQLKSLSGYDTSETGKIIG
ncbi:MAG: helix-turn-helix transcriptional regulator [Oscillospiraceae bacterium]